ncbi:MAG: hypothetical protein AAF943_07220 [Pseudomonadota bacterium]
MTALALTQLETAVSAASNVTSIDAGQGVEMFSSGSAPLSADMASGGGVALFTTSVLGAGTDTLLGEKTELFTTSV